MSDPIIEAAARALRKEPILFDYPDECLEIVHVVLTAVTPLIEAAILEEAAKALAPFARAADVYHEERFAPDDEITGRFGEIVKARELWRLRNLYTRLRARAKRGGEK